MMQNIVFIGPPGSGKGTQAEHVCQKYPCYQVIATGDLLRKEIRNKTELGGQAAEYTSQGQLVPDDIMLRVVETILKDVDSEARFIFDGFPRTVAQAKGLAELLKNYGMEISNVFLFDVGIEEVVRRILGRKICPKCARVYHTDFIPPQKPDFCDACGARLESRDDDSEEKVRRRYMIYQEQTRQLIDFYDNILVHVCGEGEPSKVFAEVEDRLKGS